MSKLRDITTATFEAEVVRSPVPVAVAFTIPGCGPCRALKSILVSLAEVVGDRAKVVTANVAEDERLAHKWGITAVPTILVFDGGREVRRIVGTARLGELKEALAA